MTTLKDCKNIIHDQWLSDILGRGAYKAVADEKFVNSDGKNIIQKYQLHSSEIFLYSKIPTSFIAGSRFLENLGFYLVDTNVIFEQPAMIEHKMKGHTELRFAKPDDKEAVVDLAWRSFKFSRFHLDSNFPSEVANSIKAEWARNYFLGKRGINMVVALVDNCIKGFLLLLEINKGLATIDLIAVDRDCRHQGIAADMITYAQMNCQGVERFRVGTQIANIPSTRLYEKLGFQMVESHYVFHYHKGSVLK